jgi:hypothetical protein
MQKIWIFHENNIFAELLFEVSAWLSNHAVYKIGLKMVQNKVRSMLGNKCAGRHKLKTGLFLRDNCFRLFFDMVITNMGVFLAALYLTQDGGKFFLKVPLVNNQLAANFALFYTNLEFCIEGSTHKSTSL